jgi:hypothetical protein
MAIDNAKKRNVVDRRYQIRAKWWTRDSLPKQWRAKIPSGSQQDNTTSSIDETQSGWTGAADNYERADDVAKSGRGSRPGEHRGGRKKGTQNKATRAVKELAQEHGAWVMEELARLIRSADNDLTRVAACRELLDRTCGKPGSRQLRQSWPLRTGR